MKTREEVEKLKESWHRDPYFDLEESYGFEEYRDELLSFRVKCEDEWEAKKQLKHDKLFSMVCPINWDNCLVERCAWWDATSEGCAVRMMSALSRTSYSMIP